MYNGIKRKNRKAFEHKYDTKFQMMQEEQDIVNGIITSTLKVKTINMKADKNIHWTDFEINNLLAAGIDVQQQKTVYMHPNIEKMAENAEAGNQMIEAATFINELEEERTNNA